MEKLKFALYWAASCGGCEIAVLDIDEKILDLLEFAEIVFWPVAMDYKYRDVESMDDAAIDVTFFNGAIRNSENEHLAKLLRQKSKTLISFGSCACTGGVLGLANQGTADDILKIAYQTTASTKNPDKIFPTSTHRSNAGEITLPELNPILKPLHQIVEVDYFIPGCPPATQTIIDAMANIREGKLPPKGKTLTPDVALCEDCPRKPEKHRISKIVRPHQVIFDPNMCFIDQGIICLGPATRTGCGARCINANMPCRGCYGPTDSVIEQGGSMLNAIASVLKPDGDELTLSENDIEGMIQQIQDPLGTFYRFSLADSLINHLVQDN